LLKTDAELNDRFDYRTSDYSNASQRPMLVIEYTSASTTPTPTPMPTNTPAPGLIFADGFESGNFSAWNWASTDGGDLSVATEAAAVGTFGAKAVVNDGNSLVLYDSRPNNETHYSARFYFHPNSTQMDGATL